MANFIRCKIKTYWPNKEVEKEYNPQLCQNPPKFLRIII